MKNEDLFNAIGDIEPKLIKDADEYVPGNNKRRIIPFILSFASVAVIVIALGIILQNENISLFPSSENMQLQDKTEVSENDEILTQQNESFPENSGKNAQVLVTPRYPQMAPHPLAGVAPGDFYQYDDDFDEKYDKWRADAQKFSSVAVKTDNINAFSFSLMNELLCVQNDENKAVSPLNVYMALAMLSETCDGNSRQQILDALGADSIESLRETANGIWKRNFCDDGVSKSIIANSLWLSDSVKYKKDTVMAMAENYLTSVYSGKMGSADYNKMLSFWIKEQTGGLLEPDAEMPPNTVLAIASTLLFNSKWNNEFNKNATEQGIFNAPDGEKTVDYMKKKSTMNYFWGEKFSAVYLDFDMKGRMWFILPDEGEDADLILNEKELQQLMLKDYNELFNYEKSQFIKVNMFVPKFDIECTGKIEDAIKKLGVTDVFDCEKADFSPLSENADEIFLSEAQHGVRVKIDEEGVSAAAYTMLLEAGSAMPPDEEVDFILDRPFAFIVTYDSETVLFAGVVNTP